MYTTAEFMCAKCEPARAFERKEMLDHHTETVHKMKDQRKWRRQYACPECGECFIKVVDMREHMQR